MYPFYPPPTPNPQQPIVFIPSPGSPSAGFDIDTITRQIAGLEALKKLMKEEKKEEKKDDKKGNNDVNVVSVVLLMILIAPITGPIMSRFFSWGLSSFPLHP